MLDFITDKLFPILVWSTSGIGVIVIQIMYYRVPHVNLFVKRLWWRLLNASVYWSITVTYDGRFTPEVLNDVPEIIKMDFERYKFRSQSNKSILFDAEGFLVTIKINEPVSLTPEGEVYRTLYVEISNIRTPFREAERLLNQFATVLTKIEKCLTPQRTKYGTTIEFEKPSPYFGLYARKLKAADVEHFLCVFHVHHAEQVDSTIQISKRSVELVSPQIPSFQELTRKYLALSAV